MKKKNKKKPKVLNIMMQIAARCGKKKNCHVICTKIKWTGRSGRPKIESFTPNQFADRKDFLY